MSEKVEAGGGATAHDVSTGRDFVGRDQINLTLIGEVSAEQVESFLPALRALLSRGDTDVRPEPGLLRITNPDGSAAVLSEQAAEALLPAARRRADPEAYLSALLVNPRYGRWAERYVPLAGALTQAKRPEAWLGEIEPELTALESRGEGAQRRIERVPLKDVTEAVERHEAWVLLGEPGSGKTTTLYRLLIERARARLQTGEGPLPLVLSLADYKDYPSPHAFVAAVLRQRLGTEDLEARLRDRGLFLLVDALNEMPFRDGRDYRERLGAWRRFVTEWPGNRVVFTCRSRDYGEPIGLPQVEIERLDDARVRAFIGRYLSPGLAATAWDRLAGSALLELVRNPYYLFILCWLVAEGAAWPSGRAGLFRGFVGHLLERERRRNHPDWPGEEALAAGLTALAEGMQPLGEGTRLPWAQAIERLPTRVETRDGPVQTDPEVLLRLGLAATLLDTELAPDPATGEQVQQVRFYHHQLQEYFAGLALLAAFRRGEDLSGRWYRPRLKTELGEADGLRPDEPLPPPPTTGWEEPTLMAAGLAGDPTALIAAVRASSPVLAARCLIEPGIAAAEGEVPATQQALLADMEDPRVHRCARIAAGEALGRLGDPRYQVVEVEGTRILLPPLVEIPAGEVTLGSSWLGAWLLARRGFPAGDERPRHRLHLPAFAIGRYPVTNAEYACFMADGGYADPRWWDTGQARAWRGGELKASYVEDWLSTWRAIKADPGTMRRQGWSEFTIRSWSRLLELDEDGFRAWAETRGSERPMDRPAYWTDERFDNPARPVVGVTWIESRAYCNWLTERLRGAGGPGASSLPPGARVRLPTEAEWERAARLGTSRRFPWGGRWDGDRANTVEGQVLRTTPVGAYPQGAGPTGVQDLSGNCWEWCGSLYRDYPIRPGDGRDDPEAEGRRVVRGGSWGDVQGRARCACRVGNLPDLFNLDLGFRLVLSLADSGS